MFKNNLFIKKINILRMDHWVKNLVVFFPLIFSNNFLDITNLILAFKIFCHFCFLSSAVYIFNDIIDLDSDKEHPVKKFRALPLKVISIKEAILLHILLIVISFFFY